MCYTASNGVQIHDCVLFAPGEMLCPLVAYEVASMLHVVRISDFDMRLQPHVVAILSPLKLYND